MTAWLRPKRILRITPRSSTPEGTLGSPQAPKKDGIVLARRFQFVVGDRLAGLVPAAGADIVVCEIEFDRLSGHLDRTLEHLETFGDDLVADSVAGHDRN